MRSRVQCFSPVRDRLVVIAQAMREEVTTSCVIMISSLKSSSHLSALVGLVVMIGGRRAVAWHRKALVVRS